MKYLLLLTALVAFLGWETAYLLLQKPDNDITKLIVKNFGVASHTASASAPSSDPAATDDVAESAAPASSGAPSCASGETSRPVADSAPIASTEKPEATAPASEASAPAATAKNPKAKKTVAADDLPDDPVKESACWRNLSSRRRLHDTFGVTEAKLAGKVVLVYAWSEEWPESVEMLKEMQNLWDSFGGSKPFALVGSYRGKDVDSAVMLVAKERYVFPQYVGFRSVKEKKVIRDYPCFFLFGSDGKLKYCGKDHRVATERLVDAFTTALLNGK